MSAIADSTEQGTDQDAKQAPTIDRYGATYEEWFRLDVELGLTKDLLPVVCNPLAVTALNSTLKSLGKTPSIYNAHRYVVGMSGWPGRTVIPKDVGEWMHVPDYGICVRTGNGIIAIDCDTNDEVLQGRIKALCIDVFGEVPPRRYRDNSFKCLYMLAVEGEFRKRIYKLKPPYGIIEMLAKGQQFVAAGTHPSGVRIKWDNKIIGAPLEVTADQLNDFWHKLSQILPIESESEYREGRARNRTIKTPGATDDVAEFLDKEGYTIAEGENGVRYIHCPFKDGHSTESNDTATAYWPAGTGSFELGHFKCMHASCAGRDDGEFLNAIGIRLDDFEDLPAVIDDDDKKEEIYTPFKRHPKTGLIKATIENAVLAVTRPAFVCVDIQLDTFRDEIMLSPVGRGEWRPFADADYVRLRIRMEKRGFDPLEKSMVRDAVLLAADTHKFDSAITWINKLHWDGIERVETFLIKYMGVQDSDYCRAVSRYMWTALAGRVLSPGCKADMVPVLVGDQGCGKSSGVAALAPDPAFFTEVSFAERDDDLARKIRGVLVAEIAELKGLNSRDHETIKAWVTRCYEKWTQKYKEFSSTYPRRFIAIGTTNEDEFLADLTGNRRWLPVRVGTIYVDEIKRDLMQLWAEAREVFKTDGIQFREAETLGKNEQGKYMIRDPWIDIVKDWLVLPDLDGTIPRDRDFLRIPDVLTSAIGLDKSRIGKREEMRAAGILRGLGYEKINRRVNGIFSKVWAYKK